MGIDIYARWESQSSEEEEAQYCGFNTLAGHLGYLREAYHGEPYATRFLVAEAFHENDGVCIPSATLRQRLPETLRLAEKREREVYGVTTHEEIQEKLQSFIGFVELCERVEKRTGKPVKIIASW